VVAEAKDLKPRSVSDLRCTELPDQQSARLGSPPNVSRRT
jgi:hypothetical protein